MSETAPLDRLHHAVLGLLDELGIASGDGPPMAYFETGGARWIYRTIYIGCRDEALSGHVSVGREGLVGRFKTYDEMEAATLAYLRTILETGKPLVWRKLPGTEVEHGYVKGYMRFVQVPDMIVFAKALDPEFHKACAARI